MEGKELSRAFDKVERLREEKENLERELKDVNLWLDEALEDLEKLKG